MKDPKVLVIEEYDEIFNIYGDKNYQQIGFSMTCFDNTVVVGSPGARSDSHSGEGKVEGYDIKTRKVKFTIQNKSNQARFGSTLAYNNGTLVVGAPSFSHSNSMISGYQGRVYLYSAFKLVKEVNVDSESFKAEIHSLENKARLGSSLYLSKDDLYIGSSLYTTPEYYQKGKLLRVKDVDHLDGPYLEKAVGEELIGSSKGGRFGLSVLVSGRNLLVGSPFKDNLKGSICEFNI